LIQALKMPAALRGGRRDLNGHGRFNRTRLSAHWEAASWPIAHDLRANAFAFVATENCYTLFRLMHLAPDEHRDQSACGGTCCNDHKHDRGLLGAIHEMSDYRFA
jgi:hypothetical protein